MSYELKSSIRKKGISLPIKAVLIAVIVLALIHFVAPSFLSSVFTTIVRPFWDIGIDQNTHDNSLPENTKDVLISQLTKENYELKEIMGRSISKDLTIGYILKKPPFTAYDSFIIDIGSNEKISKGDKAYVAGNIIIGEVEEVLSNTSKIKLYSSYGEKYDVFMGEKNIQATATGRGGGTFETVIPRDIKINEGDTITIPNISGSVFGVVGKIISDPARAFSTVLFSQPVNIYEQKWVQIYEKTKSD